MDDVINIVDRTFDCIVPTVLVAFSTNTLLTIDSRKSSVIIIKILIYYVMLFNNISSSQAFHSVLMLAEGREKHPEFCIPMTVIPATISNNVPGTDFSLGADTAVNEITDVCPRGRGGGGVHELA